MKTIGIDVANSSIKLYCDNKEIIYTNSIKEINDNGVIYSFNNNYEVITFENKKYEIGNNIYGGSGARNKIRYLSENFKLETIFAIQKFIENTEEVILVTGLPSTDSNDLALIEKIRNNLIGSYTLSVNNKFGEIKKNIIVKDVKIISQPLGTLINSIYDDNLNICNSKLVNKKSLIIDIGWGTTDLAILDQGRVRSTYGFEIGTSDYILDIQEEINKLEPSLKVFSLNQFEIDDQLRESNYVETSFGTFDTIELIKKYKKIYSNLIFNKINNLGIEFSRFYKILITGGGALLLSKDLLSLFNDSRVEIIDNAQISNAKGFYKYNLI